MPSDRLVVTINCNLCSFVRDRECFCPNVHAKGACVSYASEINCEISSKTFEVSVPETDLTWSSAWDYHHRFHRVFPCFSGEHTDINVNCVRSTQSNAERQSIYFQGGTESRKEPVDILLSVPRLQTARAHFILVLLLARTYACYHVVRPILKEKDIAEDGDDFLAAAVVAGQASGAWLQLYRVYGNDSIHT